MSTQQWSEHIVLTELQDDPAFSDDLATLIEQVEKNSSLDVLLNLAHVNYVNSSNLAKLLRLRKVVTITNGRRLILCSVNTHVWGLFLTTGLNKTFEFADDVSLGLTDLQIGRPPEKNKGK
ncbi:MAG TPA: STAS domain-containing protein [Phycisphaerae bacterium]|nr:STAS domain-containing protein [Phycisphaerae bacterium]